MVWQPQRSKSRFLCLTTKWDLIFLPFRVSSEAGGNAPFIVFDDANLDEAVEGPLRSDFHLSHHKRLTHFTLAAILCKFRGSGQTCVCANRIYVQSSIYAEFASRLAERVAGFKVGNGLEEGTYVHIHRS